MPVYLKVPFAEKDDAKALGARWDPKRKSWYVPDGKDVASFSRWQPSGQGATAAASGRADSAAPVRTGPGEPPPHCGCDALPWETCVHARASH